MRGIVLVGLVYALCGEALLVYGLTQMSHEHSMDPILPFILYTLPSFFLLQPIGVAIASETWATQIVLALNTALVILFALIGRRLWRQVHR